MGANENNEGCFRCIKLYRLMDAKLPTLLLSSHYKRIKHFFWSLLSMSEMKNQRPRKDCSVKRCFPS
jgi:hypothetical protein